MTSKVKKMGVVLLGLFLVFSGLVSLAVAMDVTSVKEILEDQSHECASCSIPNTGKVVSYESGSEDNLLREFGVDEPKGSGKMTLLSYTECKGIADEIMEVGNINDDIGAIIGLYDLDHYQILLINRGDIIFEAIYDGNTVATFDVVPELLGEKKVSYNPKKVSLEGQDSKEYNFTTETQTQLYSVPIRLYNSTSIMVDQYTVTKTRTDEYKDALMVRGKLVTKGVFYVNYGQSIAGITDQTTWNVYTPWGKCDFSSSSSGSGSTAGQVNGDLKIGMVYNRAQMDGWVSCNAQLVTDDGGSQNAWVSVIDDGCTS
jgi:hypothetical protein